MRDAGRESGQTVRRTLQPNRCAGTTEHHGEPQHAGGKCPVGNSSKQAASSSSHQHASARSSKGPPNPPLQLAVPDPALVSLTAAPEPLDTLRALSIRHAALSTTPSNVHKPASHGLLDSLNKNPPPSSQHRFTSAHLDPLFPPKCPTGVIAEGTARGAPQRNKKATNHMMQKFCPCPLIGRGIKIHAAHRKRRLADSGSLAGEVMHRLDGFTGFWWSRVGIAFFCSPTSPTSPTSPPDGSWSRMRGNGVARVACNRRQPRMPILFPSAGSWTLILP